MEILDLTGRKALVVGIANEHSLAWAAAEHFRNAGAALALTYLNDKAKPYVEPLARQVEAEIFLPCNVAVPGQLEAVFGAVYLDLGLDAARGLIERLFRPRLEAYVSGGGPRDYKTILQELASQELRSLPEYRLTEVGPDHEKEFTAVVYLAGEPFGEGTGRSKKEAEQQAAHSAFARLSERAGANRPGPLCSPARRQRRLVPDLLRPEAA